MPHFLPLVPNESHKEQQASIFQLPHQAALLFFDGAQERLFWFCPSDTHL